MRLLGYYITHTFINSIKKLFRTWVIVFIAVMLLFGVVVGVGAGLMADVLTSEETTEEAYEEEIEEDETEDDVGVSEGLDKMSEKERDAIYRCIAIVVFGIVLVMLLYNVYVSGRSGTEIFMMADVNLLFPAPLKPQTVLMFKTILQMGLVILGSVYMLFQIPNLVVNLGMGMDLVVLLMIVWVLALIAGKLCSVFVYTLTATYTGLRRYVRPFVLVAVFGVVFLTVTMAKTQYHGIFDAVFSMYGSKIAWGIPFVGWMSGLVYAFLIEDAMMFGVYAVLMAAGFGICIFGIWRMKADFYEDALTTASITQQKVEAAKSGIQKERKRKRKLNRENEMGRGAGASTFFFKQMYNRRRFAWFGFVTNSMLLYFCLALFFVVLKRYESAFPGMGFFGGFMLGILFCRSYGGAVQKECELNFIYLIPEGTLRKIFYLMLAEATELFIDMIPAFVLMKVVYGISVLDVALWMLLLISFAFVLSATTLFVHHILPTSLPEMVYVLFIIFLKFIGVFPMAVIALVFAVLKLMIFVFPGMFIGNLLAGMVLVLAASWFMQRGRK